MDYYLRTETKADMDAALFAVGVVADGEGYKTDPFVLAIDVIGQDPVRLSPDLTAQPDQITGSYPVRETVLAGFHVNLRTLADLDEVQVAGLNAVAIAEPNQPLRVWA